MLSVGVFAKEPLIFCWEINKIRAEESPVTSVYVPCDVEKSWPRMCLSVAHMQKLETWNCVCDNCKPLQEFSLFPPFAPL